jgi:hypothetical protein
MHQHGAGQITGRPEGGLQLAEIVPVDGPEIVKAHLVKDIVRQEEALHRLLDPVGESVQAGQKARTAPR